MDIRSKIWKSKGISVLFKHCELRIICGNENSTRRRNLKLLIRLIIVIIVILILEKLINFFNPKRIFKVSKVNKIKICIYIYIYGRNIYGINI